VCFSTLFATLYPFDLKESRELEALGFTKHLDFLASTYVDLCSVYEREIMASISYPNVDL
jgi:hypothetical protein